MPVVLSLQGCMAVGKTTAVRYVRENDPSVNISYEENRDVVAKVTERELDKNRFEDYIEIQKLWIDKEVNRWERAQQYPITLMDFGAEEIEFYTLNYPKTIGQNWNVEPFLHDDLERLRKCLPDRILFLDADEDTLRAHKENDAARSRTFFEHYIQYLLPLKKAWFMNRENVDILKVDFLDSGAVGGYAKEWVDKWSVYLQKKRR